MLDGGPGSEPTGRINAWLVTDEHAELMARIRAAARTHGLVPSMGDLVDGDLSLRFHPVVHTNHVSGGYLINAGGRSAVWAPEFLEFPSWAAGADLMFAEASGWNRPIRFTGGVGGHMDVLSVAGAARASGIRRIVFAHVGRPTVRAMDRGEVPPFGEFGRDGQVFRL